MVITKKYKVLLVLLCVFFILPVSCFGYYQLDLEPVQWDSGEGKTYDPFSLTRYVQKIPAQVYFDKVSVSDVFIAFSKGGAGEYDRNFATGSLSGRDIDTQMTQPLGYDRKARRGEFAIDYQLYGSSETLIPLKGLPEAQNSQDVLNYSFLGSESAPLRLNYYLVVAPGQVVPPGSYVDVFTVTLYQGNINNPYSATILDQVQVKLTIDVKEEMRYVLKGIRTKDNELMPLEFGALETGKVKKLDVAVYSNVPYVLQFTSKNQGVFKHKSQEVKTSLPYEVTFESQVASFKKDELITVMSTSNLTDKLGRIYRFEFKLDNTSSLLSGEYSDQILWNFKPL